MKAARYLAVGLGLWGIPSLIDLQMGGYGFATKSLWFWLLFGPLGMVLLYREGRDGRSIVRPAAMAGLGTTLAIVGMSVLHAWKTDNFAELGGGIQGFSMASAVAFGLVLFVAYTVLYLLPVGAGSFKAAGGGGATDDRPPPPSPRSV